VDLVNKLYGIGILEKHFFNINRNNLPKVLLVELIVGLFLFGTVPRSFIMKFTIF